MKQLLIFDFDGVICDSLESAIECTKTAAKSLGFVASITPADIAALENVTFPEIGRIAGVPQFALDAFAHEIFGCLMASVNNMAVFPEIPNALNSLAQSHILAIVTANHPAVIQSVLSRANCRETVSSILGGDTPGQKSEKILSLIEKYGFSKADTWMIGDSRSDIREGQKAGVKTLAVTWGWQTREFLLKAEPVAIIDSAGELSDIF